MESKCQIRVRFTSEGATSSQRFTRVIARKLIDELERAICTSTLSGDSCILMWCGSESADCEGVAVTVDISLQEVRGEGVRDLSES